MLKNVKKKLEKWILSMNSYIFDQQVPIWGSGKFFFALKMFFSWFSPNSYPRNDVFEKKNFFRKNDLKKLQNMRFFWDTLYENFSILRGRANSVHQRKEHSKVLASIPKVHFR